MWQGKCAGRSRVERTSGLLKGFQMLLYCSGTQVKGTQENVSH